MASEQIRVRLLVSGQVQGVFFRASTRDAARELGLTGWVRNTRGGDVEVEAQGAQDDVERLIAFIRDDPGHAAVGDVAREDIAPIDGDARFDVR
ncbi:acylphosphatase [soil metagenome]|jgi:acylphosphatase